MSVLRVMSKYYHTIKYLRAEQLWFQFFYKLRTKVWHMLGRKERYTYYKEGSRVRLLSCPKKAVSYMGHDTFCFLNLNHYFNGVWDDRALGDLWRYNLNYMDFLLQPSMDVAGGVVWIERFIDAMNVNRIAADPYPISLRGINWIKFVSLHWDVLTEKQRRKIDTSLYSQYKILCERTERHLLANHYLENGFSLLFAAVYFHEERFWYRAKRVVESQLKEQLLSDGAHYELSPMYHSIILERVLDCYNLLLGAKDEFFEGQSALMRLFQEKACLMLGWLDAIVVADDCIPLLNDSAYGVALSPKTLREYATSLGLKWNESVLGDCGYRRVVRPHYEAVFDLAPLGVPYNLGHAHADTGTFLLWAEGCELLVDTGTSTYNACERRCYERSTRAHNAVVVDEEDSSKVWGTFRCAQRAHVVIKEDGPTMFSLIHDGYKNNGNSCLRSFICKEESIEIIDEIQSDFPCKAVAYFHLASDVKIVNLEDSRVVTNRAVFAFEGHKSIQLTMVEVAKEFNALELTICVQVEFSNTLHTIMDSFCK